MPARHKKETTPIEVEKEIEEQEEKQEEKEHEEMTTISRVIYDNGQRHVIQEKVKKADIEPARTATTIEEKRKAIETKKIDLQYKLITDGLDEEETELLKLIN